VSHQRNRTVVAERAVGNGRAERLEVLIAARPELADHDRLCEMLGRGRAMRAASDRALIEHAPRSST